MSKLDESVKRLVGAVGRIEEAARGRAQEHEAALAEATTRAGDLEKTLAGLRAEHETLQRDYAALEGDVDKVAGRLDAAIDRLRAAAA